MHDRRDWSDWLDGKELGCSDTATTDTGQTDSAAIVDMDDYFFQNYVRACRNVSENTSYLEIFNYSVRSCVRLGCWGIQMVSEHTPIPQSPNPPFFHSFPPG